MNTIRIKKYLETTIDGIQAYIFTTPVKNILENCYVAIRGIDNEAGAVQRLLNARRINSIKEFVLKGHNFMCPFVLNWSQKDKNISVKDDSLLIPNIARSIQVIDGQHRLEGIKQASNTNNSVLDNQIIIILTQNLSTEKAAQIFLNINTEQKPVPQSLVFDLFSEIDEKDLYAIRINDIVHKLHDEKSSPFYDLIKVPGTTVGKIDFSTCVNSLKPYICEKGVFEQYGFREFEYQYIIFENFFNALKYFYEKEGLWTSSKNPFLSNAGFYGAVQFLCNDLFSNCINAKTFETKYIEKELKLNEVGLLLKEDLKNKQGKEQRNEVYNYLKHSLIKDIPDSNEFKF